MKVYVKAILYVCGALWCLGVETVSAQTAEAVLTGSVSADDAEAVPSAIVRLKGTHRHTATDAGGHYRLAVPEGDYTLQVSAIGYATMEQKNSLPKGGQDCECQTASVARPIGRGDSFGRCHRPREPISL